MKIAKTILILLALALVGCEDAPRGPTIPDMPPMEPAPPEPAPEPFNPGPMFSWDDTRGLLIFAGTQATEAQIVGLHNELKSKGWPTITYNVCSETTDWRGSPWAVGPPAFSKENLDNLRRFLKVTAELGDQVRLNIFCTLRDNHQWMSANWKRYTIKVAEISAEFDHVLLSIANEPYHRDSWFKNRIDRMIRIVDYARLAGFLGPMGTDDSLGCPDPNVCNFEYAYRSLGFTPDFHPFRSPDPGPGTLRALVRVNGLPLVISEPTCYSEWRSGRLCTGDRDRILSYMRRAEREGIVFFFHSTDGLQWPQKPNFDWIPSN